MATLGNRRSTAEIIEKYHFSFQKKFGQNFLVDSSILDRIIESAQITKEDCVLEIGPGIGTMTQRLAEEAGAVVAVEIDKNLLPVLEDTLSAYENVTVINADILKLDLNRIVEEHNGGRPVKVVANLPYYITTPIIMALFEKGAAAQCDDHGAERSGGSYAGGAGDERLRSAVAGGAVLREAGDRYESPGGLFYAEAECGQRGDPADPL